MNQIIESSPHIHSLGDLTPDGGLKVTTPKGREIVYRPEEVADKLLQNFRNKELSMPDAFQSIAAALSSQLQAVNREQAGDAMKLLWAGVAIARELDPNFDGETRTLEQKLTDAGKVIDSAGKALVHLERYQTIAAQHDYLQNVLATSAEYLAQGLFNSYLTPGARGQLMELLRKTINLALINIAGEIPSEVAERGAANVKLVEDTMAAAKESRPRARIETGQHQLNLEVGKEKVVDMRKKLADDRNHAERLRIQELNERRLNQLGNWTREQAGAFGNWWKETFGETVEGAKELFFNPQEGLIVRSFDSIGRAWNSIAKHVSTPLVAGLGIGGSVGVTVGLNLGTATLKAVETIVDIPGIESPVIWIPTALMGLGLGAGGGYIGYQLDEWLKNRTKKIGPGAKNDGNPIGRQMMANEDEDDIDDESEEPDEE